MRSPAVPPEQEEKSFLENSLRARQLLLQGVRESACARERARERERRIHTQKKRKEASKKSRKEGRNEHDMGLL